MILRFCKLGLICFINRFWLDCPSVNRGLQGGNDYRVCLGQNMHSIYFLLIVKKVLDKVNLIHIIVSK